MSSWPRWVEAVVGGALAFAVAFVATDQVPIIGQDEARFAQATREMRVADEWVVPTFAGEPRYDKPILIYWLIRASFAVFGETARAARLPSNLAIAATMALLALWARRRWGTGAGMLTVLLAMASPVLFIEARASTADGVMVMASTVAMLALWSLLTNPQVRWLRIVFWIAMAVAVLAKGPVAPMVVAATFGGLWAFERSWTRGQLWALLGLAVAGYLGLGPLALVPLMVAVLRSPATWRTLRCLHWSWGLTLFAALTLPWAVAAQVATNGDYLTSSVGRHVLERGLSGIESHGGFPGFYVLTGVLVAFPWFLMAVVPMFRRWRTLLADPFSRFLVAWLLGTMVVFEMVETRMVHYLLPAYPAGVLLVVGWLRSGSNRGPLPSWLRWSLASSVLVLGSLPAVVVFKLELGDIAGLAAFAATPAVVSALLLATMAGRISATSAATTAAAGSLLFLLVTVAIFLPRVANEMIAPRAAEAITRERLPGEQVLLYKLRDDELLFLLPGESSVERESRAVASRLEAGERLLIACRERDLDNLHQQVSSAVVAEVARVEGVDLGRGRWAEMVLLRPNLQCEQATTKTEARSTSEP